jgi:hypothetical protein
MSKGQKEGGKSVIERAIEQSHVQRDMNRKLHGVRKVE